MNYFSFFNIVLFMLLFNKLTYSQNKLPYFKDTVSIDKLTFEFNYYLESTIPDTVYLLKVYLNSKKKSESYVNSLDRKCRFCKIGKEVLYYSNGKILSKGNYEKGLKNGKWLYYSNTGALLEIINYKNNMKVGKYFKYNERKILEITGTYFIHEKEWIHKDFSSKVGIWKFYFSNGRKKRVECFYKKVIRKSEDEYQLLSDGSIDTSKYKRNVLHGKWKYWDITGKLLKIEKYYQGKLLEVIKY